MDFKERESRVRAIADEAARAIVKSINIENTCYQLIYNGKSIRIENINENTEITMWIRVIYNDEKDKARLDFSTVEFGDNLRRKGIFTTVINSIKNITSICEIRVTGVCTKEMFNWCKKNGFVESGVECDFKYVLDR